MLVAVQDGAEHHGHGIREGAGGGRTQSQLQQPRQASFVFRQSSSACCCSALHGA
jgi:hypothetical protein